MTQYNRLNVKLSNLHPSNLKSAIKNKTDIVLRISSNMVGNSNDNTNFPHQLLLIKGKFQILVKLLLITYQLTLNCQKLNYQKRHNQENFLVNF